MRRRRIILFPATIAIALAGVYPVAAQQPVQSVIGTVRDTSGAPLSGAAVTLGERRGSTDSLGAFRFGGLAPGRYPLTIRLLGYQAVRSVVPVIATEPTELDFFLVPIPVILPITVVTGNRTGIFGIVGDSAFRKAVGVRVQLLGSGGGEVRTDTSGRFAFPEIGKGVFVVRVTHPGYTERRFLVELSADEGRELAILLTPAPWEASAIDELAIEALGRRLSWGRARERVTGRELAAIGSGALCSLEARVRADTGPQTTLILNGRTVIPEWPVSSLCSWHADEIDLVEFGHDYCADATRTIADRLGGWCGVSGRSVPRSINPAGTVASSTTRSYVVIWEKR